MSQDTTETRGETAVRNTEEDPDNKTWLLERPRISRLVRRLRVCLRSETTSARVSLPAPEFAPFSGLRFVRQIRKGESTRVLRRSFGDATKSTCLLVGRYVRGGRGLHAIVVGCAFAAIAARRPFYHSARGGRRGARRDGPRALLVRRDDGGCVAAPSGCAVMLISFKQ